MNRPPLAPWTDALGWFVATPARVVALTAALVFVFLAAIHGYLSPPQAATTPGTTVPLAHPPPKMLAIFVDGLRPENVDPLQVPVLWRRKTEGFYAEVEPCYDRLTVPCLHEAFTGTVNSGLLGAWRNLVSNSATADSNLFADLAAQGKTIGVVHHGELSAFSPWFTMEYTGRDRRKALQKQFAKKLDFIVYHYVSFDESFHKNRPGTRGYTAALAAMDAHLGTLFDEIPPEYTWVVFGDHGHNEGGRHILGLDVPTVFIAPPDPWGQRLWDGRIPIATLRYLVGANFGILPPPQYEGADLAPLLEPDSAVGGAARAAHFEGERPRGWFPWWGVVAALGLAAVGLAHLPPSWRPGAGVGLALAALSGAAYPYWVPWVHATRHAKWFEERLLGLVAVVAVLGMLARRGPAVAAAALGLCWLALPGTLYEYGLFQNLPVLLSLATALVLLWAPGSRLQRLALAGTVAYAGYLLSDVTLGNFALNRFRRVDVVLEDFRPLLWGAVAAVVAPTPRRKVDAFWIAALGGAHLWRLHDGVVAVLTLAAFWSWTGWPRNRVVAAPETLAILLAWLSTDYYENYAEVGVALVALLGAVAGRVGAVTRSPWFAPTALAAVTYVMLSMTAGLRTNGLDFGFALHWFPGAWHERLWFLVGLAMVVKAIAPAALVLRAHAAFAPDEPAQRPDLAPVLLRLAAGAIFLFAMFTGGGDVGRARVIELVEDQLAWVVVLLVLAGRREARPAGGGVPRGEGVNGAPENARNL